MLRGAPIAVAVRAAWRLARADDGQDLVEYGLLAALIALVALGAVTTFGAQINNVFWTSIANNF